MKKTGHLEVYTVTLQAEGPIFIGSGVSMTKKEYIFDERKRLVHMPDPVKFASFLTANDLMDAFAGFMLSGTDYSLFGWCREHGIREDEFLQFIAYTFDAGDAIVPGKPLREIQKFIKNPNGEPYIPGSSLKGALRTALLAKLLLRPGAQGRWMERLKNEVGQERIGRNNLRDLAEQMEQECLHLLNHEKSSKRDAVNSVLKALSISDSRPVGTKQLVLCSKLDVSGSGAENQLNLTRECIKPGTVLEFKLTADASTLAAAGIDIPFLMDALRSFGDSYENEFSSKFRFPTVKNVWNPAKGALLYIGGGAGYRSKTVVASLGVAGDAVYVTSRLLSSFFRNHRHEMDIRNGVSPHMIKYTICNGQYMPFGQCRIQIQ